MDLRRQVAIVRAWLPLVVASTLLAAVAAFVVSNALDKVYESRATLIVGQSLSAASPDYSQLLVSQRLSTTYAAVATTRPILEAVIDQLGLDMTADQLAGRVRAAADPESTLLTITAQDGDPDQAAALANALAEQLIAASPAIQGREADFQEAIDSGLEATLTQIELTQTRVDALAALPDRTPAEDGELQTLEGRLVTLRSTYTTLLTFATGNAATLLTVVEPAASVDDPVSPRPAMNTLLGAALGLLAALALAFTAEFVADPIKDVDAVSEATGLPTLGTVGRMRGERGRGEIYRLAAIVSPRSAIAESYRSLRTNVEFAAVDRPLRSLLVTSSVPGEGKTITASNIAVVFAQAGRRVVLVDADLRKPGVHDVFGLGNEYGLTTLLHSDEAAVETVAHQTDEPNLRVLTAGPLPPNPAELLGSQRMRMVLDRLLATTDLVVFDAPPLQAVADAAVLSSFLDGTLIVIDAGRSRRRSVRAACEALARANATVLGAVLNRTHGQTYQGYEVYGPESAPADSATSSRPVGRPAS